MANLIYEVDDSTQPFAYGCMDDLLAMFTLLGIGPADAVNCSEPFSTFFASMTGLCAPLSLCPLRRALIADRKGRSKYHAAGLLTEQTDRAVLRVPLRWAAMPTRWTASACHHWGQPYGAMC